MERYLTPTDVAEALQVSVATARTIIKANIPYVIVGREIRVKESDVDEYLEKEERRIEC